MPNVYYTYAEFISAGSYPPDSTLIVRDASANIAALSGADIANLSVLGAAMLQAEEGVLRLTASQVLALGSVALNSDDTNVLADTGANTASLTASDIATLAATGITIINTTDNVLNLSVAQFRALGSTSLTSGDLVKITDSGVNPRDADGPGSGYLGGQPRGRHQCHR